MSNQITHYFSSQINEVINSVIKMLLGAIVLLFPTIIQASFPSSTSQFTNFNAENGLAIGGVETSYQDSIGFMWFGGSDGLARYDGYEFEKFFHDGEDPNSISSTSIWSIFEDAQNNLWVTTENGINLFDRKKQSFTTFKQKHKKRNMVRDMLQDKDGLFWLGTVGGLVSFDWKTEKFTHFDLEIAKSTEIGFIQDLELDTDGNLWIATGNAGVFRYNPSTQKSQQFYLQEGNPMSLQHNRVWEVIQTRDGMIWLATELGLTSIDLDLGKTSHIEYDEDYDKVGVAKGLASVAVTALGEDVDGNLWIGSPTGISVYNRSENKFAIIRNQPNKRRSLGSNVVRSIYQDVNGDMWIGSFPQGVSFFNRRDMAFETHHHDPANKKTINHKSVLSILEDSKNRLWFGTDGGGLNFFDPTKETPVVFKPHPKIHPHPDFISGAAILGIMEDYDGSIWVGMWGNGISVINPNTGKIKNYMTGHNGLSGLKSNNVWGFYRDSKNRIWLSTIGGGLVKFNRESDNFTAYMPEKNNPDSISSNVIWTVLEDSKGQIWVGSGTGLDRFDEQTGRFIHYQYSATDKESLGEGPVVTIHEDSSGEYLWVGTRGGGLCRFNPKTGKVKRYQKKEGLIDLNITSIEEDDEQSLWLGTYGGLVQFNQKTEKFRLFDRTNGLQGNIFNHNTSITLSNGDLIFGGTNGYTRFKPNQVKGNKFQPLVVFRDLKILNKTVRINVKDSPLKQSINETKQITFDHTHRVITFLYSGLSYRNPEKNQYAYKLEGFDEEWNWVEYQRRATYTSLSSGDYIFKVKASNSEGVWSETPKMIHIKVLPPPWLSWWAYGIYTSMFLFLIGSAIQHQRNKRKFVEQQNRILESKVQEKTADIKSILLAIQQGILAIEDEDGRIGPEHSEYLEELVGTKDIIGRSFYDLLFNNSAFTQDEKSQIMGVVSASVGEDSIGFTMNSHLLPREANIDNNGEQKIYELDWNPIMKGGIVTKILLVVRDVTLLRALEKASKKQRREIEIIQEIINVPADKFDSMITSCYRFIEGNRKIINSHSQFKLQYIQQLFRNMHTMKGLARSYSLRTLSEAAHIAEQFYSQSIESKEWVPTLMLQELAKAKKIIDSYKQVNKEKLGRSSKDRKKIEIDRETVENNLELLSDFDLSELSSDKKSKIRAMKYLFSRLIRNPLEQVLRDQVEAAASLARQLKKTEPLVIFDDPGFSINIDAHELINNIFTHLIRNSIDHGLETPEERIAANKPVQGKLTFKLKEENTQLQIKFSDDGRGLNLPVVYQSALKIGLVDKSDSINPEYVANLIFASGISTSMKVTDISGRGVGMDAVKNFLESEGCSIEIRVFEPTVTELSFSPFEFVITLPTKFFQYMGETEI